MSRTYFLCFLLFLVFFQILFKKWVKKLGSKKHIENKNEKYAYKTNKRRKYVRFELGDWVRVSMRKERFPKQMRSNLMLRGDG